MRKLFKFIAPAMAGIMLLFGCAATAPASKTPAAPAAVEGGLTFTTGGEQGTYYRFGLVLAEKIAASTDTVLNTVVSEGSQENINALQNGSAMVGFAQTDVLSYAYEGTRLFDSKADKISMIAELYKEQLQIITLDPGLKSVADLKGKNVSIGSCGFGMGATPNAIANMQAITNEFGPAPVPFVIVSLVGGLFIDFFNSAVITAFANFL